MGQAYHMRRTTGLLTMMALGLLAGCGIKAPVSGFRPVFPELTTSFKGALTWSKVDSLQPTLRWEPFPGSDEPSLGDFRRDVKPFVPVDPSAVRDLTYELRIWRVENGVPREVVYERKGIQASSHRLERPLEPNTKYYWSVRARFEVDGKFRVSEWSMSTHPCIYYPDLFHCGNREVARLRGMIPSINYYRFKTPSR